MSLAQHTTNGFEPNQLNLNADPHRHLKTSQNNTLIDLLYDGFYIVFLLKNHYAPQHPEDFRGKILTLLNRFEQQAQKLQFNPDDIQDAKYAYCALLDEIIVTQTDASFFDLQNIWLIHPLQLKLFGSQLAGDRFFESLEQLRSKGKDRLAGLEIFYYCLLLGFQGKYRITSTEHLTHLMARVGDEIEYLKGKKNAFAPYAALPDQIKNLLHKELPFIWVLLLLFTFALLSFAGLRFMLARQEQTALSQYQNVISTPVEQAHITIHLP